MNPSPKQIIDVTENWLKENADNLPLEVRVLIYKAIDDAKEIEDKNEK